MRFVDTSFWFALTWPRDHSHAPAKELIGQGMGRIVVTNQVLGESWTFIRRRLGHRPAVQFMEEIANLDDVEIVHVDAEVEADAWLWLRRHDEREYSFVDATSFAVMRRRRIREALAFDGDFASAGFIEVRP